MMVSHRNLATIRRISLVLLSMFLTSCGNSIDIEHIDIYRLCSISKIAHDNSEFSALLIALEQQFGIDKAVMRIAQEGIYVPISQNFVTEEGFFVAKPELYIEGQGTDPSYHLIENCIYSYEIKG